MNTENKLYIVSCMLFVTGLAIVLALLANHTPVLARTIDTPTLTSTYGGDWECTCEIKSYTCNSSPGTECSGLATQNAYCSRCSSDAATEHCVEAGYCLPYITCSDCVVDDPHECGQVTEGSCTGSTCEIADTDPSSSCGTASQCHTV